MSANGSFTLPPAARGGVLVLSGSPAARSRSTGLARHASQRIREYGVAVDEISVLDLPAADLIGGAYGGTAAAGLRRRVHAASAVVITTPIYKASFAGGLKALLDLLDERALVGKTVLPLATGGSLAHLLAVEYSLKPVLSALGARHVLSAVFACDTQLAWREDGGLSVEEGVKRRLDDGVDDLLASLGVVELVREVEAA